MYYRIYSDLFRLVSHSLPIIFGHPESVQEHFFPISFCSTLLPGQGCVFGEGEAWCLSPGLVLWPLFVLGPPWVMELAKLCRPLLPLYRIAMEAPQNAAGALEFL